MIARFRFRMARRTLRALRRNLRATLLGSGELVFWAVGGTVGARLRSREARSGAISEVEREGGGR